MYRNKFRSGIRSKPKSRSKPKAHSRPGALYRSLKTPAVVEGDMPNQHCERDKDGVRRCEPEKQYEERMDHKVSSRHSPMSSSSTRLSNTSRRAGENSSILEHAVKQAYRKHSPSAEMDAGHHRRVAVAKRVDEWLIHQDNAEPLEQFSSLRFSDTNAVQRKFGQRTVEQDTIATHYDVKYVDDDDADESSSYSGDYSSSDGTGVSDFSGDDDDDDDDDDVIY
jgi:hypothetical protein